MRLNAIATINTCRSTQVAVLMDRFYKAKLNS